MEGYFARRYARLAAYTCSSAIAEEYFFECKRGGSLLGACVYADWLGVPRPAMDEEFLVTALAHFDAIWKEPD